MLGYHASIYRNQLIKKNKKKQILNKTKSINRNVLRKITGNKVIAQINQQLNSTDWCELLLPILMLARISHHMKRLLSYDIPRVCISTGDHRV